MHTNVDQDGVIASTFDEDQIVAYSAKRKSTKNTKHLGKKSSPTNAFLNNSTLGDMSHVWSKYRRNMHENVSGNGGGFHSKRVHVPKAHSMSRQEYLVQQHKHNQHLQMQLMHQKVTQYQQKLLSETQPAENLSGRQPRVDRFSHSIGRVGPDGANMMQRRSSNKMAAEAAPQANPKHKIVKVFSTMGASLGSEDPLDSDIKVATSKDGAIPKDALARSSLQADQNNSNIVSA